MRSLFCFVAVAAFAQLPEMKVEATDGGSALVFRNLHSSQAITAYLVELVDYPGSSFAYSADLFGAAGQERRAPGATWKVPIQNMTVGAAPDYVKVLAVLFADGSSAGSPQKVTQLIDRRRTLMGTLRELIARLEKGQSAKELEVWASSTPINQGKTKRSDPAIVTADAVRMLVHNTAQQMATQPAAQVLAMLRENQKLIAASKPPL